MRSLLTSALAAAVAMPLAAARAADFHAMFSGFNEVGFLPPNEPGAILSEGTATLHLHLNNKAQAATFKPKYSGLSSPIQFAAVFFGKVHVAGGFIAFLCADSSKVGVPRTPVCTRALRGP